VTPPPRRQGTAAAELLFGLLDADGDGVISLAELRAALSGGGRERELPPPPTPAPAERDPVEPAGADRGTQTSAVAAEQGAVEKEEEGVAMAEEEAPGPGAVAEAGAMPRSVTPPRPGQAPGSLLPAGWEVHVSRSTGQRYYHEAATGRSSYVFPGSHGR
jgi:hypothetical protein